MDIFDKGSIILGIGDIKLSDTDDTFGKRRLINGYEYIPLLNPNDWIPFRKQLSAKIAYGDYKCGTNIGNGQNNILLSYGANRINSNAQSMALGYLNELQYFFIVETFGDIYAEKCGRKPELTSRRLVTCKDLWKYNESDTTRLILYHGELNKELTKKELDCFSELAYKIEVLHNAFKEDNLRQLRIPEKSIKSRDKEDEEER